MKKIIFILTLFVIPFCYSQSKTAHINYNELLQSMPEMNSAKLSLDQFTKTYQAQLNKMQEDYKVKSEDFQKEENTLQPAMKSLKVKELQDLEASFLKFKEDAQLEINNKEKDLLAPIIKKAKDAVEVVVKEKKYNYVIDSGAGQYVYLDPNENIMLLVKSKLGIK
jgi:outer membrane protein